MANRDLSLALKLYADSANFVRGLNQGSAGVKRFTDGARREFDALRNTMRSVHGQLATVAGGVSLVGLAIQSAKMDKSLGLVGQTATLATKEVDALRAEFFSMASKTGQQVDALQQSFSNAVASGLNLKEAVPVVGAVNTAMAVTGASADKLTSSLTVAATAFQFDLSKPGQAVTLLDQMTVAGRKGNAELENLSDIFARVGVNAAAGGLGFQQTLAFIEGLSMIERQPERLATLADSTLRLFTNLNYAKDAAKATGVRFFDQKTGERRNPLAVLADMKAQFDKQKTDKDRALFMQKAFGKADLDTIKGLRTLFQGDMLTKIGGFTNDIKGAGGTLERDLPKAISNAVDQTGRLRAELRKAADDFARPINDTLQQMIKFGLDSKANGGLALDGKDMVLGGAGLAVGTLAAARYGGKALGALASKFGGAAAGLATGKALEAAAGVTPVFVVNMPSGGLGDLAGMGAGGAAGAGAGAAAKRFGWRALAGSAGLAAAPLAVMAGVSSWAGNTENDKGRVDAIRNTAEGPLAKLLGFIGLNFSDRFAAQRQASRAGLEADPTPIKGEIRVRVDQDGRVSSVRATSGTKGVNLPVDAGATMVAP
jgi:hypothetical protein